MSTKRLIAIGILLCAGMSTSLWARDSSTLSMGKQVTAATYSYVLASGISPNVQGDNQLLGFTPKQCQVGTSPQVVVSVSDAGASQHCPLSSFHTENPFVYNNNGGYVVFIGYINVDIYTSLCHDRGASLNWTINCVRTS